MELLTKSGEARPVEMSATFIEFSGREIVFAIARDISARKVAEQALRASEERLRFTQFALDHAQDIVSIMDREGNRLYVSETFCNFTGRTQEELFVSKVWEGIPSLNRDRFQALWDDIKRCGTLSFEIELLGRNEEKKPVETNATYLNFGGREAVCTISRDLTTRKSAEAEKKRMQLQLQETQKLESLGVLAGGIAHDFNNLLTGILGNASLARDRLADNSELHEPLRQIERASTRAAELCQQMLAYAGKGRFIVEPIDLSGLVEDTAKLLDLSVGRRAALELRLAPDLPSVLVDATQMRQIVMNLVLNAAEAISHPQGKIVVSTGEMRVDQTFLATARVAAELTEGPGVFLEVSDNGEGMNRETLERVFEPFFTTKFTGRGLGLAAVLGIVRAHQGALHVQSERGRGTTFRLVLAPHHEIARKAASLPPFRTSVERNQGCVLVVDDEESVRSVTRQALERIGFKVETAEDGEVALTKLAPDPRRFTVILLDYTMPRLDGAQTLREILRLNPQARVILMSGFPEQEARERLGQDTLAGFVQKPFDLPTLRAQVERVVQGTGVASG
jgi:PAS domain S-box-containing protein